MAKGLQMDGELNSSVSKSNTKTKVRVMIMEQSKTRRIE